MKFNNYYKGKKVLITGHTGFKGSWLSIWLKLLGADICGVALEPKTEMDNFVLSDLKNKINHNICDIRDYSKLSGIVKKFNPEIVFHLAAQPLVKESYKNPIETFQTNIIGTVNVLEAIKNTKSVNTAIMITSDKCYENNEWYWGYRENDSLGGKDPYSASKASAEIIINSYRESFLKDRIAIASVRAGNVIGGGDWSENRIVPDIVRALNKNNVIELRNPNATRPWQHVLEPLSGYLLIGSKLNSNSKKYSSSWNFGPSQSNIINVKELTKSIIKEWGEGEYKDVSKHDDLYEAGLLSLDCSKANHLLDWRPTLNFRETIRFTIDWYKKYFDKQDIYDCVINQIEEYEELSKKGDIYE